MRRCYASIPALMLLSVGDLSLQRTPRSISSMSEWTLWHEQWVKKALSTMPTDIPQECNMQKRRHTGAGLVCLVFFYLLSTSLLGILFACCGISGFLLWPEAHQAESRDGEQASCLDTKLFWQGSADSRLCNGSSWLAGSTHEETILPRGSFGFEHDGREESCPIGSHEGCKRCVLTSPGLEKICHS